MAKGLKIPLQANAQGGIATVEGDDNDLKIIELALSDGDNENAFQQEFTLGQGMIFDINDPIIQAGITRRLREIFSRFEAQKRFKLLRDTIKWKSDSTTQELTLTFRYLNIESDEVQTFEKKYGTGG